MQYSDTNIKQMSCWNLNILCKSDSVSTYYQGLKFLKILPIYIKHLSIVDLVTRACVYCELGHKDYDRLYKFDHITTIHIACALYTYMYMYKKYY